VFHALAIILIVLYFHRVKYHGAFGLAYNPIFYRHTAEMKFLQDFVNQIPSGKKVMTLNNLAPHLTHADTVMLLGDYKKLQPDIIALDVRPGQNPSNYWPVQENYLQAFGGLASDPNYKLTKFSDTLLMFVKMKPSN